MSTFTSAPPCMHVRVRAVFATCGAHSSCVSAAHGSMIFTRTQGDQQGPVKDVSQTHPSGAPKLVASIMWHTSSRMLRAFAVRTVRLHRGMQ